MFAIKRVSLDQLDAETFKGYTNEISLLKRLEGNARIIRLYESEMKPGNTQGSKGHLVLLMELGEIDMAKLLSEQMKEPPNMVWVAYYWQQVSTALRSRGLGTDFSSPFRCFKLYRSFTMRKSSTLI